MVPPARWKKEFDAIGINQLLVLTNMENYNAILIDKRKDIQMEEKQILVTADNIQNLVYTVRGQQVMLDSDLAEIYGYTVRTLNQQVNRNIERFPEDFMFQLTQEEWDILKSQIVTSSWGGKRKLPYVFTEQGVYMLTTVLKKDLAVQQSIAIMRAFKEMRHYIQKNPQLATRTELNAISEHLSYLKGHVSSFEERVDKQILDIKKDIIENALKRIGKLDISVDEMIGSSNQLRYRNKMIFPIGIDKNGKKICGFYRERSHDIVELNDCLLGDEIIEKIIDAVMKFIEKYKITVYNEEQHKGIVRRLFFRKGFYTGEIMVVLSINAKTLPHYAELAENISNISDNIKSVILNFNTKKTNAVLGDTNAVIYGKETITDFLLDMKYEISPHSFFQINPLQTEKLYNKALEFAEISENDKVMDLYCGIGTISLSAAKKAKSVIGVEIVEQAILDARKNAEENNIKNVTFYAKDAQEIVPTLIDNGEAPDVVILDPPRKGSDEKTLGAIVKANPKRIVYVSCNPATLARDLRFLEDNGFKTKSVCGVDMFSQTMHIESVALIVKRD